MASWTLGPDRFGHYHAASGRIVSRQDWHHWREQAGAPQETERQFKARRRLERAIEVSQAKTSRQRRMSLGELTSKPRTRKQTEVQQRKQEILDEKKRPQPDARAYTSLQGIRIRVDIHRFEGLEAEQSVRQLLRIVRDEGASRVRINIGTGYGRHADWIGSKYELPHHALEYLEGWRHRPSAQAILNAAQAGKTVWWEIEVIYALGRKKNAKAKRTNKRTKRVRRVQRRRSKKLSRKRR